MSGPETVRSRHKRSLLNINPSEAPTHAFKLSTPAVNWHKRLGSDDIGADFGTSTSNKMDLTIGTAELCCCSYCTCCADCSVVDPWKSDFNTDMKMKSWVNAKLGYLDLDVELLDIDLCFNGKFGFNVNVMTVCIHNTLLHCKTRYSHVPLIARTTSGEDSKKRLKNLTMLLIAWHRLCMRQQLPWQTN